MSANNARSGALHHTTIERAVALWQQAGKSFSRWGSCTVALMIGCRGCRSAQCRFSIWQRTLLGAIDDSSKVPLTDLGTQGCKGLVAYRRLRIAISSFALYAGKAITQDASECEPCLPPIERYCSTPQI